jgi:hypothetical protein
MRTTTTGSLPRNVIFEVILHEEATPWAEWDVFWNEGANPDEDAGVITRGTAPSLEAAIDKALKGYDEWRSQG